MWRYAENQKNLPATTRTEKKSSLSTDRALTWRPVSLRVSIASFAVAAAAFATSDVHGPVCPAVPTLSEKWQKGIGERKQVSSCDEGVIESQNRSTADISAIPPHPPPEFWSTSALCWNGTSSWPYGHLSTAWDFQACFPRDFCWVFLHRPSLSSRIWLYGCLFSSFCTLPDYCIAGNFRREFNFVAFVREFFWLNYIAD